MDSDGVPTKTSGSHPSTVRTDGDTHTMVPCSLIRSTTSEAFSARSRRSLAARCIASKLATSALTSMS